MNHLKLHYQLLQNNDTCQLDTVGPHYIRMKAVYGMYNEWNASGFMVITSKLLEQQYLIYWGNLCMNNRFKTAPSLLNPFTSESEFEKKKLLYIFMIISCDN